MLATLPRTALIISHHVSAAWRLSICTLHYTSAPSSTHRVDPWRRREAQHNPTLLYRRQARIPPQHTHTCAQGSFIYRF